MSRRRTTAVCPEADRVDSTANAVNEVQAHMGRVDTKASILFGFALAALTGGAALASKAHLSVVGIVLAIVAAGLIGSALILLGAAIRPALKGNHGFVRYAAAASTDRLVADLAEIEATRATYCAEQLLWLSRAVQRKYRRVRLAVDLLMTGLGFAALTAISAIVF